MKIVDNRKPTTVSLMDLKIGEAFQLDDSIGIVSELTGGLKTLILKSSSADDYVPVYNLGNCTLELRKPETQVKRIESYELHLV